MEGELSRGAAITKRFARRLVTDRSAHTRDFLKALTCGCFLPALLVLDGFDEAPASRARILDWVEGLDDSVDVIVTSRPAAVGAYHDAFSRMGFTAHRVVALTRGERAELVRKFARRSACSPAAGRHSRRAARPLVLSVLFRLFT